MPAGSVKEQLPRLGDAPASPGTGRGAGSPGRRVRRPGTLTNYLYLVPAILLVGGIVYYSIGYTVYLSGFDWDGVSPTKTWIGFGNYTRAFHDPVFWKTVGNMALFACTIVIQMAIGLTLAVLLHSRVAAKAFYKVVIFTPVVLAPAVMAPVFRQVLAPDGALNNLLSAVGLHALAHPWLADPGTALWALIGINVWQWTGLTFLLYYAALSQVDTSVLEAARLDGVGSIRLLRHILLPSVRGTTLTLAILGVIGVLKTFDVPYLVTSGGPFHATEFLSTYIYLEGLTNLHAGYGAALSVLLLVMSLIFTVYQVMRYRQVGK